MTLHRTPIDVRFGDTDMFGHVNNAAFATYVETARLAFFRDVLGGSRERPGGDAGGIILARLSIDFRRQLLYGAAAEVTTEVGRIGRTSVTLKQVVLSDGETVADVETVIVAFDYESQTSQPIPEDVRLKLDSL